MAQAKLTAKQIQNLLEAAKHQEKINPDLEEVKLFIETNQIKSGKTRVPNGVIYLKYIDSTDKPMSRTSFFIYFKRFFTRAYSKMERFYLLDKCSFDTSRENISKARALLRKENEKKEKNKKIKS